MIDEEVRLHSLFHTQPFSSTLQKEEQNQFIHADNYCKAIRLANYPDVGLNARYWNRKLSASFSHNMCSCLGSFWFFLDLGYNVQACFIRKKYFEAGCLAW